MARFSVRITGLVTDSVGKTWAGGAGNHVYILTLEGDLPASAAEPPEQQ